MNPRYRKQITLLEENLKKYLPKSEDLPTTKKDNNKADKQLALRITAPLTTSSSKFGLFATDKTRFLASASKNQLIKFFKQEAQDSWVRKHAEVLEDIKSSGRWLPGEPEKYFV